MKRLLLMFIILAWTALAAAAQTPIRWRMSVAVTGENEGTVTLRALIEPGWHLYGTTLPDNGPKPTEFDFRLTGVSLDGKMSASRPVVKRNDPLFGVELSWWDSNVEFVQPIRIDRHKGAKISVTISYMGCNDATCLPPKTQTLTYVFK